MLNVSGRLLPRRLGGGVGPILQPPVMQIMDSSAFDTDMDAAAAWPVGVDVDIRVDYPNGPPEYSRLRLTALSAASAVGVTALRPAVPAAEPQALRWTDLPGRTLYLRCLHVLAVHLFGSVEMAPRIVGMPLWTSLTLDMMLAADDPQALHLDVCTAGSGRAQLRWRLRRDQPTDSAVATLDHLDADPLRAVLRLGIAYPKAVRQRPAAGGSPPSAAEPRPDDVAVSSSDGA